MQKKNSIIYAVLISLLFFSISCSQQPIFWAIEQEIKLLDPSIRGNVHTVVRLSNRIYAANGLIYSKIENTERGWQEASKPDTDGNIVCLAADSTNLYALSAKARQGDIGTTDYQVWVLDGSWKKVTGTGTTDIVLFDNGVNGSDRAAYVRVEDKVYKLNNTGLGTEQNANGANNKTVAAARSGGSDHFANTKAFCSNGSKLYKGDGKTIKYGSDFNTSEGSVSTGETVTCLVYDAANSRLIVGTKKGLEAIILDSGGVPQKTETLGSNAEAAFGESEIFSTACFGNADGNAIYAGVGKTKNSKSNALWGYYPSRGNWNYE